MNKSDLQKIADELEFDLEDVEMLLGVFIESAEDSLASLNVAVENNDYDTIFKEAHAIKGSAGNLTLNTIFELAKVLENEARESRPFNYKGTLSELVQHFNSIK